MVVPGPSGNLLRIMEATSEGTQVYSLKARLMAYAHEVSNVIVVRKFNAKRTPEIEAELAKFVDGVEGNPYSIMGVLHGRSESERGINGLSTTKLRAEISHGTASSTSSSDESDSSSSSGVQVVTITPSSADSDPTKRKYFCSSLAASALKQIGWLKTNLTSSHFWPGSFEDGGEIERVLADDVTLGPETVIDCRIVEVGLATSQAK